MGMYNETVSQSFALRLLMHYVGDVHQPLHGSSRYSSEYPTSDVGGNLFTLENYDGSKNLHAAWDALVYSQHSNIKRPIPDDYYSTFFWDAIYMNERSLSYVSDHSLF